MSSAASDLRSRTPADVAGTLGVPTGEANSPVRRRRLRASDIPARLKGNWSPLDIAEGVTLEEDGPVIVGGVKSALAELGYPQVTAHEWITPSRVLAEPCETLRIEPGRAISVYAGWCITEVLDVTKAHGHWNAVLRGHHA